MAQGMVAERSWLVVDLTEDEVAMLSSPVVNLPPRLVVPC